MKNATHTLGFDYQSYDNHQEFARMRDAFTLLLDAARPTLYRTFNRFEQLHLADMRNFIVRIAYRYEDSPAKLPVINCANIADTTDRGSTVAECCAATLKLIDEAAVGVSLAPEAREAVRELAAFTRWQWLHPAPED